MVPGNAETRGESTGFPDLYSQIAYPYRIRVSRFAIQYSSLYCQYCYWVLIDTRVN